MLRSPMSRSLCNFRRVTLVAVLLLGSSLIQAQINTGRIMGTVRDASGAVIPEARVLATSDATGTATTAQSTESGDYVVNFLIPGAYHVAVEKQGFQRSVASDVVVNAGGITRMDFSLALGAVQQAVEVMANPLSVATETSELSKTFSYKELDQLPNI